MGWYQSPPMHFVANRFDWSINLHDTTTQTAQSSLAPTNQGRASSIVLEMSTELRSFTLEELRPFDGKNDKPVYVSLKKCVYDVSAGKSFYGPGGPYSVFAGRDASFALATMNLDASGLDADYTDLSEKHEASLQQWVEKFASKYEHIGTLTSNLAATPSPQKE